MYALGIGLANWNQQRQHHLRGSTVPILRVLVVSRDR